MRVRESGGLYQGGQVVHDLGHQVRWGSQVVHGLWRRSHQGVQLVHGLGVKWFMVQGLGQSGSSWFGGQVRRFRWSIVHEEVGQGGQVVHGPGGFG